MAARDSVMNPLPWIDVFPKPRYKKEPRSCFVRERKPGEVSKFLISRNWIFLQRDPSKRKEHRDDTLTGTEQSLSPVIHRGDDMKDSLAGDKDDDVHCSKQSYLNRCQPNKKARQDRVIKYEHSLLKHPLALYPHFEQSVSPQLFEQVLSQLDPELLEPEDTEEKHNEDVELLMVDFELKENNLTKPDATEMSKKLDFEELPAIHQFTYTAEGQLVYKNRYRWLAGQEEESEKEQQMKSALSPSQDEHIRQVTKEFYSWVESLGGENNIEESTLINLFATGYESKPALSVPIHVVELTSVPPELRMSAVEPRRGTTLSQRSQLQDAAEDMLDYDASPKRFRYGAWYLPKKYWKKRDINDPLTNPKLEENEEKNALKIRANALDENLASLHGTKAFLEFVDKKKTKRPEFLKHAAAILERQELEQQPPSGKK